MARPDYEQWHEETDAFLLEQEQKLEEMKHFLGELTVEEAEQEEYKHLIVPDIAGKDL